MTQARSRRKRQARMAVIAVAAAAVLGLVTTVAMAATHRTSALTPTAGVRTTTVTASSSAQATGTGSRRVSTSPGQTPSVPTSGPGGAAAGGSAPQGRLDIARRLGTARRLDIARRLGAAGPLGQWPEYPGRPHPGRPGQRFLLLCGDGRLCLREIPGRQERNGQVSGQVTNAVSGEVAKLYVQEFPFTSPAAAADSVALDPSGTTAPYSFPVTPTLATRYTVEVFRNSTATPLATSAASTIYVVPNRSGSGYNDVLRPEMPFADTVTILVPASALSTQMAGHHYTYFGINYGHRSAAPTTLTAGSR